MKCISTSGCVHMGRRGCTNTVVCQRVLKRMCQPQGLTGIRGSTLRKRSAPEFSEKIHSRNPTSATGCGPVLRRNRRLDATSGIGFAASATLMCTSPAMWTKPSFGKRHHHDKCEETESRVSRSSALSWGARVLSMSLHGRYQFYVTADLLQRDCSVIR